MKNILKYLTPGEKEPFNEWFQALNWVTQAKIDAYIVRVTKGAAKKNVKPVGSGVYEIKIDFGSGYRVYFGEIGNQMILLLLGGDKSSQRRDIRTAIAYWRDYCEKNPKLQ